ncbi:MAG: hypothetical protein ACOZIN_20990 [Myxococcota bacterium]
MSRFAIGRLTLELSVPSTSTAATLFERWGRFADAGVPRTRVEVILSGKIAHAGPRHMPLVETASGGGVSLHGEDFVATVSPDRKHVELRQADTRYPIEAVAKWLLADALAPTQGLLVHGVGIAFSNQAFVFVGPSGAGKSTLAALCQNEGMTLLADELVALERAPNGGFVVQGTPWNSGSPMRAWLCELGTLAWGAAHRLESLGAAELLRTLLPNTLLADPSPPGRAAAFRAASALLTEVPAKTLTFARKNGLGALLAGELP